MTTLSLEKAIATGMLCAYHAERQPLAPAVDTVYGNRTFAELNIIPPAQVALNSRTGGISTADKACLTSFLSIFNFFRATEPFSLLFEFGDLLLENVFEGLSGQLSSLPAQAYMVRAALL